MIRVVPLVAVLALGACSKSTPAAAAYTPLAAPAANAKQLAPQSPQSPPPQPVPAQLPEVVARVNGEAISKADFDEAVKELEASAGQPVPAAQRNEEEAFKQVLTQRSLTVEKLRSDARDDLLVSKMLQAELGTKTAVTPAQVTEFYQQNPGQFEQGERVRASHILIAFPENADTAAKQAAKVKAEGVLKDVKSGKDFAALAKVNSQDPGSAPNGGDLGFFQQGQMVPAFDAVAFKLAPGEISDLVETNFGYHIIKVAEKSAARTVPLDDVRPQLEQYLEGQNRQLQTQAFVESLKAKGKVEIFI